MQTILTIFQVFLSLGLIGLILIQHGKGADAGAAFGSGASATVFGSRGSGSFLTRATAVMATIFFLTSMALAYYATKGSEPDTIMNRVDDRVILMPDAVEPVSDIPAIPGEAMDFETDEMIDVPSVPGAVDDAIETETDAEERVLDAPVFGVEDVREIEVVPGEHLDDVEVIVEDGALDQPDMDRPE
ncbi:preprotein translocase subunit SecG [Thiocapsa imhoffii]|uniref:Protein-export membrane protein SecG n=1 Tax=Thiocapsa imhoffii TaxID=382777 RepID=A0A9X0WH79_9GAMM|nr:preprotein translocase subunit SecG [Thiocapsa imhoffii]